MTRLVIAATEAEGNELITTLQCMKGPQAFGWYIYYGTHDQKSVVLIICGPGMANAAAATALGIERYQIDHVYNVGVCGVYADDDSLIGTAVAGEYALFADTGAAIEHGFMMLQDMALPLAHLMNSGPVFNAIALSLERISAAMPRCIFSTVAAISASPLVAKTLFERCRTLYPPALICEDMESAAVALIAARAGLPCTVIRGISNQCGNRDRRYWKFTEAAAAAQNALLTCW
ncbi:MAG: futalosine hydrolase [Desulfobacterota bacterium]|nr:futalosine hydrolase [Thermodesulfobacteriota bacterium]